MQYQVRNNWLSKQDSNQSMHFMCIAFSRRKTRAKLRRARSGEFAARNSVVGGKARRLLFRPDFRAQNRLDFRRIVRIGVVMGWPRQSRPRARLAICGAWGRASVKSGAANQRSLNMSTPSIAKSRNLKTAASKKKSIQSSAIARRWSRPLRPPPRCRRKVTNQRSSESPNRSAC